MELNVLNVSYVMASLATADQSSKAAAANMTKYTPGDQAWTSSSSSSFSNSSNGSFDQEETNAMAVMYGTRFVPYTIFVFACFVFNVLSIGAMLHIRGHRSVHHVMLLNLAVCDMVGSVLIWVYYNSPLIFPRFEISRVEHCLFLTMVLVAPYILSLCNSFLCLLMLALNQYLAICYPLWSATKVTKGRARVAIGVSWGISLALAVAPGVLTLALSHVTACAGFAGNMAETSLEICAYALAALILLIVALYARVYRNILLYRRDQQPTIRRNRGASHSSDSEGNYKAFITTAILTGTLVIFWLPYMVFHFISAHVDVEKVDVFSDHMLYVKFYIIDFLPVLNFLTDPIVYGIRMKEIRVGYLRMFARILPCCCRRFQNTHGRSFQNGGSLRSTVRFTTLDTTL